MARVPGKPPACRSQGTKAKSSRGEAICGAEYSHESGAAGSDGRIRVHVARAVDASRPDHFCRSAVVSLRSGAGQCRHRPDPTATIHGTDTTPGSSRRRSIATPLSGCSRCTTPAGTLNSTPSPTPSPYRFPNPFEFEADAESWIAAATDRRRRSFVVATVALELASRQLVLHPTRSLPFTNTVHQMNFVLAEVGCAFLRDHPPSQMEHAWHTAFVALARRTRSPFQINAPLPASDRSGAGLANSTMRGPSPGSCVNMTN